MRKISIMAAATASLLIAPLAMAQQPEAPAPKEEPAPQDDPAPTTEPTGTGTRTGADRRTGPGTRVPGLIAPDLF
jgi:hypothetical protein